MLVLFGKPGSVYADILSQREDTKSDDYFHLIFSYQKMRVILHSSSIGPKSNLRFKIQASKASYIKYELDPQENDLKNGKTPNDKSWGVEATQHFGKLYTEDGASIIETLPGRYEKYYQEIAGCVRSKCSNPVTTTDAISVIQVIEACFLSAREKRIIFFQEQVQIRY